MPKTNNVQLVALIISLLMQDHRIPPKSPHQVWNVPGRSETRKTQNLFGFEGFPASADSGRTLGWVVDVAPGIDKWEWHDAK